jgi:hypothetical protein
MDILVLLHLTSISFWLGVISVEFIFERARIGKDAVIRLHKLTDRYVEMPITGIVLLTGMLLWARSSWALIYLPKVLAGLGAVGANVFCYYCVEQREPDKQSFKRHSLLLFKATIFGLICLVLALFLGGQHAGWWFAGS